jgi:hypothetical protein
VLSIRFRPSSTKEVGIDYINLGRKKVRVVTDANINKLTAIK